MQPLEDTVETLDAEIQRLVAEGRRLRERGASQEAREANRRRLADAQWRYSQLLIQQHLDQPEAA